MQMDTANLLKPYYPDLPIGSIDTLARVLGLHPRLLLEIAKKVSNSYTSFDVQTSKKLRTVHEPKFELKKIQKRINSRIMERVQFPAYLTGGIKDETTPRDYVFNASFHTGNKVVIKLDIKNFYMNIRSEHVRDIFKYFFKFPDDVANVLTLLTTYHNRVPQGASTSSYLANLVFFNSEYALVSHLRNRGFSYSRLLDDITISSKKHQIDETDVIKKVASMCRKYDLKLNNKKTEIDRPGHASSNYKVTGIWVKHGVPKIARSDRRYVRMLVYIAEGEYAKDPSSENTHNAWNKASGHVAKLKRLRHPQARVLRARLCKVMPIFGEAAIQKIRNETDRLISPKVYKSHRRAGLVKRINKLLSELSILSRTNKTLARSLKLKIDKVYPALPTKKSLWED